MSVQDYGEPEAVLLHWDEMRRSYCLNHDGKAWHFEVRATSDGEGFHLTGTQCLWLADMVCTGKVKCEIAGIDDPESALAAAREAERLCREYVTLDGLGCQQDAHGLIHKLAAALTLLAPERKDTT